MITIVIPIKNDLRIFKTIDLIVHYFQSVKINYEIIVSGEIDFDKPALTNVFFIHVNQARKGKCIKKAIQKANGNYIIILDADFPIMLEDFKELLNAIEKEYDVILFNRYLKNSYYGKKPPIYRLILSITYRFIVNILFNLKEYDTQCGAKCLRKDVAKKIIPKLIIDGFSYDVDLTYLLQKMNLSLIQLNVHYIYSASSLNLIKVIPSMIYELLYLFFKRKL